MARRRKSALSILFGTPSRRKPKGFFGTLLEGQRRTEKQNVPGSKRRK
nr:MAG TPA: hypothetical protein [Caudoviricetes sp.]